MKTQIPIYRAKKIDSDEFVEGFYHPRFYMCMGDEICSTISTLENGNQYEIDPLTLAIHFPNMLDKNGKKIFASLSEDGKGGDIVSLDFEGDFIEDTMIFSDLGVRLLNSHGFIWHSNVTTEVIGIQK